MAPGSLLEMQDLGPAPACRMETCIVTGSQVVGTSINWRGLVREQPTLRGS